MLICEKRKGTAGYDTVRGKKERDQKLENCEVEKRSGTSSRFLFEICGITLAMA